MHNLEQFNYNKLTLKKYYQNLKELLENEQLKKLNITYSNLGKTAYNYNIDCITIGKGEKELFLVAGTHGSEIITTDFLLNFIKQLPNIKEFNPNEIKLIIIPLQNPEGFDISTNTTKKIKEENFDIKSYDYYINYKIDCLLNIIFKEINNLELTKKINPSLIFKNYINTNQNWLSLTKIIPELKKFNILINKLDDTKIVNYNKFLIAIINICKNLTETSPTQNKQFTHIILELNNFIITNVNHTSNTYINKNKRLHQEMFKNINFNGLKSHKLTSDISKMYEKYNHPKGSQITHDSTGIGINLNANNILNPGIEAIKNHQTIYGLNARSNIQNYVPGPLGIPTTNITNFKEAIENEVLESLIKESIKKGKYLATFLYHGTGGLIYYKPHEILMSNTKYQEFLKANEELANIYHNNTNYKILTESDTTGYGDYLRRTYPKVLLIELSKMGGNPIGPYGDKENIYKVFNDNTKALTNIINNLTKRR